MAFSYLKSRWTDLILWAICGVMAVTLQIQTTLFQTTSYLGLRISLADLFLPLAGLFISLNLFQQKSAWPIFNLKNVYIWLTGLAGVLVLACLHTYFLHGYIPVWAWGNKVVGWCILCAFLLMGGWVGTNTQKHHIIFFLRLFLYFSLAVLVYQLFFATAQAFDSLRVYTGAYEHFEYQLPGLMKNRNAYAILMVFVYAFVFCDYFQKDKILPPIITNFYLFLLPAFFLFNASRAGIFAISISMITALFIHRGAALPCVKMIAITALGLAVFLGGLSGREKWVPLIQDVPREIFSEAKVGKSLEEMNEKIEYSGDSMRLTVLDDAITVFQQNPVFGSGLGANLLYQKERHGEIVNIVDSTPVWLATETGIVGLLCFALFYIFAIRALLLSLRQDGDFMAFFRTSVLLSILAFSIMCLLHEIMYTRHVWFLMGIALAVPLKMRQDAQTA
jgi:hypothetical protein